MEVEVNSIIENEIISFLEKEMVTLKSSQKKIDSFNDFLIENEYDRFETLKFLEHYEAENVISPYYSFLTGAKVYKLKPQQIALGFIKFVEREGSNLIYLNGYFLKYTGKKYKRIKDQNFQSMLVRYISKSWPLMEERTSTLLADVLIHLRALCSIDSKGDGPFWLLSDGGRTGHFIPLQNGIFDVQKYLMGEEPIVPHSKDFICEYCLPYKYEAFATSIFFESFLESTFEGEEEKILFVQECKSSAHLGQPCSFMS
jgi:hypothetical protein